MEGRASKAGLEGSHGALWETLEAIDVLFKKLREAGQFADSHPLEESEYYSKGIDAARLKLEKYFGLTDATPAYRCAVALHPANKWNYFEIEWAHNKQWISDAKKAVKEVYAQYEAAAETAIPTTNEIIISSDEEQLDPLQQARKRRRRIQAAAAANKAPKRTKHTTELDEFMSRANSAGDKVEDPLAWWIKHEADYPTLATMALDFFSIPAMSSECERVFSQSKKTMADERNRIDSDTVAAIECQEHLLRSGIPDT